MGDSFNARSAKHAGQPEVQGTESGHVALPAQQDRLSHELPLVNRVVDGPRNEDLPGVSTKISRRKKRIDRLKTWKRRTSASLHCGHFWSPT